MSELFDKPRLLCDPEWYKAAGSGDAFRIRTANSPVNTGVYVTNGWVYDIEVNPSDDYYWSHSEAPLKIVGTWNAKLNNAEDPFPRVDVLYMPDVSPTAIGCLWKLEPPCNVPSYIATEILWFSDKSVTAPWGEPIPIEEAQKDWEDGQVIVGVYTYKGSGKYTDFVYGMFMDLFPVSVNAYSIGSVLLSLLGGIDELEPDWTDVMYIDKFKYTANSYVDEKFVETSYSVVSKHETQEEVHRAIKELLSAAHLAGDDVTALIKEYKLGGIVKWM